MTDFEQLTLEQRKTIYRARRGLKELDVYFDPYVKNHYLQADAHEKQLFATLIEQEDPDLLDWFMEVSEPPSQELKQFILKLKHLLHG
ncbi:MAG: succinate dehydrogenase assembly factor 2 [Acinetobacter sp.]|nr:succinate dehydrogenase assembly factor 2 [Acinetobacter sp.]